MQVRAPAKINLSLQILERRPDGFHEIETLMAPISLFDSIAIELSAETREITFRCDDESLPMGEDNLVVRAARSFLRAAEIEQGLRIELQKNIPHGAGLGGGSSDAAAVLLALNQLLGGPLTGERLTSVAAEIGSDVPFFLAASAAFCRGRGEIVEPTALGETLRLLLLKPAFGVPTRWAYARWRDSSELPGVRYSSQNFAGYTFVNDLERSVFEKHVFLGEMKMWLLAQPEVGAALLSGSGSTLFAALRDGTDGELLAERAKTELDAELWTYACAVLPRQP